MTTKFIPSPDLALYLDVSSGSNEAYETLKRSFDVATKKATAVLSKMDVRDIEAYLLGSGSKKIKRK